MEQNIYLEKVSEFARLLRHEGLTVGLQEVSDACTILQQLPLDDRATVKAALRAVLAKSQLEQATFDRCFDGWFVSLEEKRRQLEQARLAQQELEQNRAQAQEDLQYRGQPMDLRSDLKDTYARMPEQERERLRQLMERYKGNIERQPELYGNFIHSVFMRALLEQQMALEDAAVGVEAFDDPELELLLRDLSMFQPTEIPRAIELISKIARQFNGELTAKRRQGGHSGKLDFKRTIRKGLETGGSLNRLCFKRKRKRRRRLVLLCDVSGSMLQFSEFALHFIRSMSEISDASRTFLFSETLHEVDPFALQSMEGFRSYVKTTGLFGKGTNLGAALAELTRKRPAVLNPSTTLLILSDTKTVNIHQSELALLQARRQAGRIIWLNPIPERKWPYINSIQIMAPHCKMVPCSTLQELASACKKLVKQ